MKRTQLMARLRTPAEKRKAVTTARLQGPLGFGKWNQGFPRAPKSKISVFADSGTVRERKDITVNVGGGFLSSAATPTFTLLNGAIYGASPNQHVGRTMTMKSVQIRWSIQSTSNATIAAPNTVRVMIVYDKEPNGAPFIITDLLVANDATAPMNLSNSDRFIMIMDKVIRPTYCGPVAALSPAGTNDYSDEFYRKISLNTQFNAGSAGTVGDITTGSLYLVTYVTNPAGALPALTAQGYTRVRFTDA